MSLLQYYNDQNKTLILPYTFSEPLTDVPKKTNKIYFICGHLDADEITDAQILKNECIKCATSVGKESKFNHPIGHQNCNNATCAQNLPNSITHLFFGYFFDQSVDKLPSSITHLTFGVGFNNPINLLPDSITHLSLKYSIFKKSLDKLPHALTYLVLSSRFNENINLLPKSVKTLGFRAGSNIQNNIPDFVETIIISFYYPNIPKPNNNDKNNKKVNNLPSTIKKIMINIPEKINFIKVPFGCVVTDLDDKILPTE